MSPSQYSALTAIATSLVLCLSVTGCGGGEEAQPSDQTTGNANSADHASALAVTTTGVVAQTVAPTADATTLPNSSTAVGSSGAGTGTSGSQGGGGSGRSGIGLNLGAIEAYSAEIPTIDLMKRANPWLTQCGPWRDPMCKDFPKGAGNWDTLEESKLDLDADGWVRSLPAAGDATVKFRSVLTVITSGSLPGGKYTVLYDGSGTLAYSGTAKKVEGESKAGRDVVSVTAGGGGWFLSIMATTPGNYLRNIRVLPPGGACANDLTTFAADATACNGTTGAYLPFEKFPKSAGPWHPAFLKDLQRMRTLRYMDWGRTNQSQITSWAQRHQLSERIWGGVYGAPIETMIDLSNVVGADPWINIPSKVDDDYVRQFARLVRQRMAPGLTLNLEYSNEAWNYMFPTAHWMMAQAKATWPEEVSKGTNVYQLQANWYAKRHAEVCRIAKAEFGAEAHRVRCILGAQAASVWMTNQALTCPVAAPALGQPCAKYVDVLAIAPYFGHYIMEPKLRPQVRPWYTEADGGLNKMFQEIGLPAASGLVSPPLAAVSTVPGGALSQARGWMKANSDLAVKFNIPMWAYEAGQHLVLNSGDNDTSLQSLMVAANRDARMGQAYARYFADWQATGGQTMVMYSHVSVPSKWGMWGLKEDQFNDSTPKWQAVLRQRDQVQCWWAGC